MFALSISFLGDAALRVPHFATPWNLRNMPPLVKRGQKRPLFDPPRGPPIPRRGPPKSRQKCLFCGISPAQITVGEPIYLFIKIPAGASRVVFWGYFTPFWGVKQALKRALFAPPPGYRFRSLAVVAPSRAAGSLTYSCAVFPHGQHVRD